MPFRLIAPLHPQPPRLTIFRRDEDGTDAPDDPEMLVRADRPGWFRMRLRPDPSAGRDPIPDLPPGGFVWPGVGYIWVEDA